MFATQLITAKFVDNLIPETMRQLPYKSLNINQKINCKGFDQDNDRMFGRWNQYGKMFKMNNIATLWPEKIANQLLTIRYTNQGYKNY